MDDVKKVTGISLTSFPVPFFFLLVLRIPILMPLRPRTLEAKCLLQGKCPSHMMKERKGKLGKRRWSNIIWRTPLNFRSVESPSRLEVEYYRTRINTKVSTKNKVDESACPMDGGW